MLIINTLRTFEVWMFGRVDERVDAAAEEVDGPGVGHDVVAARDHQRHAVRRQAEEERDHDVEEVSGDVELTSAEMLLGLSPVQLLEVLVAFLRRVRPRRDGRRRCRVVRRSFRRVRR